jgi:preprotein translocase subunit SecY
VSEPIQAFKNAFKIPELKSRIIFTLTMLAVYRLGCHVPTPGVDGAALAAQLSGAAGEDVIEPQETAGGAFVNATVFALGIMPYITASIIISLLVPVIPALEQLQKSGQDGQKKITEWTRYATIGLAVAQSIGIAIYLQRMGTTIVPNPGIGFITLCVISFTTGTAFIMWVGEQITEHGIGNGMSLIIFTSIISQMPVAITNMFRMVANDQLDPITALVLVALMVAVIAGAIVVTTGQRRIPVQYPRAVGRQRVAGGTRTYLPLRVNQAGVIPIIFASSILMLPGMLGAAVQDVPYLGWLIGQISNPAAVLHSVFYAVLIIFFSFFYTAITFNPVEMADNMKKYGGVIIGVRPGKATADYLNKVMTRITLAGSIFLVVVALVPTIIYVALDVQDWMIVHFFGGTTLLILVGVALDTIKQVEQHLIMRHYDGFSGKGAGRIRARRGM